MSLLNFRDDDWRGDDQPSPAELRDMQSRPSRRHSLSECREACRKALDTIDRPFVGLGASDSELGCRPEIGDFWAGEGHCRGPRELGLAVGRAYNEVSPETTLDTRCLAIELGLSDELEEADLEAAIRAAITGLEEARIARWVTFAAEQGCGPDGRMLDETEGARRDAARAAYEAARLARIAAEKAAHEAKVQARLAEERTHRGTYRPGVKMVAGTPIKPGHKKVCLPVSGDGPAWPAGEYFLVLISPFGGGKPFFCIQGPAPSEAG